MHHEGTKPKRGTQTTIGRPKSHLSDIIAKSETHLSTIQILNTT